MHAFLRIALIHWEMQRKKINGFADLIREFRRKMQEGSLEELFKYITDETGYIANLKAGRNGRSWKEELKISMSF